MPPTLLEVGSVRIRTLFFPYFTHAKGRNLNGKEELFFGKLRKEKIDFDLTKESGHTMVLISP